MQNLSAEERSYLEKLVKKTRDVNERNIWELKSTSKMNSSTTKAEGEQIDIYRAASFTCRGGEFDQKPKDKREDSEIKKNFFFYNYSGFKIS